MKTHRLAHPGFNATPASVALIALIVCFSLLCASASAQSATPFPSASPLPSPTPIACPQDQIVTFNFDVDSGSNPLPAGTIVTNQFAADFLNISGDNATDTVLIFDSANPTGDDFDLGTPNQTFAGGVGIGSGGESGQPFQNSIAQEKILILAEDTVDVLDNATASPTPDGLVDDPDDDASGGKMFFDFNPPVQVLGIDFLDIESATSGEDVEITGYESDNSTSVFGPLSAPHGGDNSFVPVDLSSVPQTGFPVYRLEVNFISTSGAVGTVTVCEQERDCLGIPGGNAVDLGCGCNEPGPGKCGCTDEVDLGCGCGEPGPGECGCSDEVNLGCGCGEPAPGECGCEPCFCGNGQIDDGEICDDGNDIDSDGCNNDCRPSGIEVVVNTLCEKDAPYVEYQIFPFGFTPGPDPVTLKWEKADGSNELVETIPNQPLSGKVLWTGADVDGEGNGIQWPGWQKQANGLFVEVNDGLRPQMTFVMEVNPTQGVVIDYPPGTPNCNPNPECPEVDSPECLDCEEKNITTNQFSLDGLAADQARVLSRSVRYFRKITGKRKALKSFLQQADEAYLRNWATIWSLPSIIQTNCNLDTQCVATDNTQTIESYFATAQEFVKLAKKIKKRIIKNGGSAAKARRFVKKQLKLIQQELALKADIPTIAQDCSGVS